MSKSKSTGLRTKNCDSFIFVLYIYDAFPISCTILSNYSSKTHWEIMIKIDKLTRRMEDDAEEVCKNGVQKHSWLRIILLNYRASHEAPCGYRDFSHKRQLANNQITNQPIANTHPKTHPPNKPPNKSPNHVLVRLAGWYHFVLVWCMQHIGRMASSQSINQPVSQLVTIAYWCIIID